MKYWPAIGLVIVLLNNILTGQEYLIDTYADYEALVNLLEGNQQYQSAIDLTLKVWDQFPEKEFDLMKELIYLHDKTGQFEKNLDLWAEGHQKGYFFLLNKGMDKYKPYLEYIQYEALVKKDETLRLASFEKSQTIYEVVLPENPDPAIRFPLLMILHGGGSNMERTRARWKMPSTLKNQYIIAYLQSYRHMDSNTFGWTSSDQRAHRDIRNCLEKIVDQYPVDTTQVILCGMSSGGTMAFDVAFNRIITVRGIIAFCPGKPWSLKTEQLKQTETVVYMIGGAFDYYLPRQQELVLLFRQTGIHCSYKIIEGMGHEFPENYSDLMREGLRFISDLVE
jgi:predicted esterase